VCEEKNQSIDSIGNNKIQNTGTRQVMQHHAASFQREHGLMWQNTILQLVEALFHKLEGSGFNP
jgi:hypothetical protein